MPQKLKLSAVLGAAVSGTVTALAFPKFDWMFVAWISLLPLLFLLAAARPRHGFLLGWTAGAFFYGILLNWIPAVPAHYGRLPLVLCVLIYLILVLLLALTWAFFGLITAFLRGRFGDGAFFIVPFVWIGLEYLISHVLTGFPWGLLGLSQYKNTAFIQISSVTGIYGVSFMLVLFQSLFVASIRTMKRLPFAAATIAMAAVHLGGFLAIPKMPAGAETFRAAVIQGNVASDVFWSGISSERVIDLFDQHMDLTRQARRAGADLIIWPEFTVPLCFSCDDALSVKFKTELEGFVRETGATLLLGTTETAGEGGKIRYFNSALGLAPERAVTKSAKMHLVPFGEYTPYKKIFGFVNKLSGAIGETTPGRNYALHSFRNIPFGAPICYEIVFPDLVRRFVKKGARFLVTITNDGWYGRSSAPYQEFAAAAVRAAENGRFLLRAATTGISGIIDPAGRVLQKTEINARTFLVGDITPIVQPTFYARNGDVFCWISLTIAGLFFILALFKTNAARQP